MVLLDKLSTYGFMRWRDVKASQSHTNLSDDLMFILSFFVVYDEILKYEHEV